MRISYLTEPVQEYQDAITNAETPAALVDAIRPFRRIAEDAFRRASELSDSEWTGFRRGLASERSGTFAGEQWAAEYGDILFPAVMFHVSMVAQQFGVPWGTAYIRVNEEGLLAPASNVGAK